jgi:hypothetical protein
VGDISGGDSSPLASIPAGRGGSGHYLPGGALGPFQEKFWRTNTVLNTQVLKGLQYMHKFLGITHGDLSLSNIHIMEDGGVKIGAHTWSDNREDFQLTASSQYR